MDDAIAALAHDHAALNRCVLELTHVISGRSAEVVPLADQLEALREALFLHFAREEEGLFPFAMQHLPAITERFQAMAIAHDTICGSVARMCHLAATGAEVDVLKPLFERFTTTYAAHAEVEAAVLEELARGLSADARAELAALVRDL
jgi:iron-sulfur cluster repair protein YtfE (RIC family)